MSPAASRRKLLSFIIFVMVIFSLFFLIVEKMGAEQGELSWELVESWDQGLLYWNISLPIEEDLPISPSTRRILEKKVESLFPGILLDSLYPLIIDSSRSLGEAARKQPELRSDLASLGRRAELVSSRYSSDMRRWESSLMVHLYPDLLELFLGHAKPQLPKKRLTLKPIAEYTGILIYVEPQLPVHGVYSEYPLHHALFPQILDEELKPVITASMVEPEILRNKGMLLYLPPHRIGEAETRVGTTPLRISAGALFGKYYCDIIIPQEAAAQILGNNHNINLIKSGKIAVITSSD
jgi:hypothetical protein